MWQLLNHLTILTLTKVLRPRSTSNSTRQRRQESGRANSLGSVLVLGPRQFRNVSDAPPPDVMASFSHCPSSIPFHLVLEPNFSKSQFAFTT